MRYPVPMKWLGWSIVPVAGIAYLLAQTSVIPDLMKLADDAMPSEPPPCQAVKMPGGPARAKAAMERVKPLLEADLTAKNLHWGDPVFLRAFKEEAQLEVFLKDRQTNRFVLFRSYPIVALSGKPGPKLLEGDGQVPEGFYHAGSSAMKSDSVFHLAINIGYPNEYDRAHGRTGSFIMIHGNRVSIGCLAMTDEKIEEIYSLCDAALNKGQPFVRIHVFPFRMSKERMETVKDDANFPFWQNLFEGYELFEEQGLPAETRVIGRRYVFTPALVKEQQ
jgi:murein L,D-transpeptidase YafK